MAECVRDKSAAATREAASSGSWAVGVIAPGNARLPCPCLEECLEGDPARAATHGCAMLKQLVETRSGPKLSFDADDELCPAPATCGQGYGVSLFPADGMGDAHVLILRPPTVELEAEDALAPPAEAVRSAAVEAWRLNAENNGLADEVLRSYEQINLIFDVSAQIAILSDGDEVRQMLLTKLKQLFDADAVFLVLADEVTAIRVDGNGLVVRGWVPQNAPLNADLCKPRRIGSWDLPQVSMIKLPPEFEQAREQLTQSRRVFVSTADSSCQEAGHGTSLWGSLADDEERFSIVGIIRRNTPFTSGDMLLLDSTLTYGGHILRNLQLVEKLQRTSFEVVRMLVNAIDQKDNYTSGHSERVGFLARATGQRMGLSGKQLKELEWAALLHDIGKIGIPESVLNKPGRLTEEEYAVIKGHPSRGHEILDPVASLEPVIEGVLHHHENPDGSGYPAGLEGDEIPLLARIVHVVDVFDALTSTRSYRKAYKPERALGLLKSDAGTKLHAGIVEQFFKAWAQLPVTHPEEYERWFGSSKEVTE